MKLRLRDYQRDAIQATISYLYKEGHFSGIVAIPTGGGKTFTVCTLCELIRTKRVKAGRDFGIIWIAHRDELIAQAAEAFQRISPKAKVTSWVSKKVEAERPVPGPKDATGDVVVAMINSTKKLASVIELIANAKKRRYIVVVDEAHHFAVGHDHETKYSNMYLRLIHQLKEMQVDGKSVVEKMIGLTATPERLDKRPLGFDGIAYKISFIELVRRGHLAKPVYREMRSHQYAKLDVRGGEFTAQSLERLNTPARNASIVNEIMANRWRYGKTLVFCCTRQHCKDMNQAFLDWAAANNEKDRPPVHVIDGTNTKLERRSIKTWLDHGNPKEFKVLLNCMVYTEGFDCPSLNSIVLARPTMSEALWMQMVGRGARVVKARGIYPRSYFMDIPDEGTQGLFRLAGDKAKSSFARHVKLLEWSNPDHRVKIPITSRTTEENHLIVERAIKSTFNLTVVSDDITRFATLIKEWELHISPDRLDDEERKKRKQRRRHAKKVEDAQEDCANRIEGRLDAAQLVNVQGILVFSTLYQSRIGIPIDEDRADCLRALKEYADGCWVDYIDHAKGCNAPQTPSGRRLCNCRPRKIFDKDMFAQSYTFCVTSGAIPSPVWNKMIWGYYFYHIRGKRHVLDRDTGKPIKTWDWVELTSITEEMQRASRLRVSKDLQQAGQDNIKFNMGRAGGRDAVIQLFSDVFAQAMKDKKSVASVAALNQIYSRIIRVSAKDRKIVVRTDIQIGSDRDPWIRKLFIFREAMTAAMQDVLGDSCCMVQAVSANSSLSITEAHEFKPGGKWDKKSLSKSTSILLPDTQI